MKSLDSDDGSAAEIFEEISGEPIPDVEAQPELTKSLRGLLHSLGLTDRQLTVLQRRYGFPKQQTLAAVGIELSVSRERVRQIEVQAKTKALQLRRSEQGQILLGKIERLIENLDYRELGEFERIAFHKIVRASLSQSSSGSPAEAEIDKLAVIVRSLGADGKVRSDVTDRWPKLTFMACMIKPRIEQNSKVIEYEDILRMEARQWSYEELAVDVLRNAGVPLHRQEIAQQARALNRRPKIHEASLFNMLTAKPETFARTDAGTYGLKESGYQQSEYYPDLIARVIGNAGAPLGAEEVYQRVAALRSGSAISIKLFLDLYPRFYMTLDQRYGLRVWLRRRAQFTESLPAELVEDPGSARRVGRAISRGYDVKRVVDLDANRPLTNA